MQKKKKIQKDDWKVTIEFDDILDQAFSESAALNLYPSHSHCS